MKKTRIKITHQLEKTNHVFLVHNPSSLSQKEKDMIMAKMNVEMLFVHGRLYKKY
jgi:hypothetical protein